MFTEIPFDHIYTKLFKEVDNTTMIVTSTNRLANAILYDWLKFKTTTKTNPVIRKFVFSLKSWVQDLWYQQLLINDKSLPLIISDNEAILLISEILRKKSKNFLYINQQAKEILSAWQLLCQWKLNLSHLVPYLNNLNTRYFFSCIDLFKSKCQKNNWIDNSQTLTFLSRNINLIAINNRFNVQKIYFMGFDVIPPDLEFFIDQLSLLGIQTLLWRPSKNTNNIVKFSLYSDKTHELITVANLAKKLSVKYPEKKIGIIVPDLQNRFLDIQNIFDKFFLQKNYHKNPLIDNSKRNYKISGGRPLIEIPIVFQLLQWLMLPYINTFGELLEMFVTPYIKGAIEFSSLRKKLSFHIKKIFYDHINIKELINNKYFQKYSDLELKEIILENKNILKGKHSVKTFISSIKRKITLLGWPGQVELSSLEYQALEKFYQVINSLSLFERLNYKMTEKLWLFELKKLAQIQLFQSKSNPNTNIHILGLLESTDLNFDHLFIIGMDAKSWPGKTKLNIYLPYQIQKKYDMPHSSIKKELDFAKKMTIHLLSQATNIHFSYADIDENNQKQIPSSLLSAYKLEKISNHFFANDVTSVNHITINNQLNKINNEEKLKISYGVSIFKNMAECPYRAALIHRLNLPSNKNHQYKKIFDIREKGKIIHHILEYAWYNIKNLHQLQSMSISSLENLVMLSVDRALKINKNYLENVPIFMQIVEKKRLQSLVKKWLLFESKRTMNFSVKALEKNIKFHLLGIEISLRIDRIDRLDNGKILIIDYKSSENFICKKWINEPIKEPQLPLYAIAENADAIAVGLIHGRNITFKSILNMPHLIQKNISKIDLKISKNFIQLKEYWKDILSSTMKNFLTGDISLTPSIQNCQYCEFIMVCRKGHTTKNNF